MKNQTPKVANRPYTLTRPIVAGEKTAYFRLLESMVGGRQVSNYGMINQTTQALRESGLIVAKNRKGYVITESGLMYVNIVNSSNIVPKEVLNTIMNKGTKE